MSDIEMFSSKVYEIEAVQITEENLEAVAAWCGGEIQVSTSGKTPKKFIKVEVSRPGRLSRGFPGNWVTKRGIKYQIFTAKAMRENFVRNAK